MCSNLDIMAKHIVYLSVLSHHPELFVSQMKGRATYLGIQHHGREIIMASWVVVVSLQ